MFIILGKIVKIVNNWEFAIIDKSRTGLLLGFSYIPDDDFTEFNIYLLVVAFHFKFY